MSQATGRLAPGARVLLTGATGLIGKEVGKLLVERGYQVVVTSRQPAKARLELPFPAEIHGWEGEKHPFPREALNRIEGVIHLAGEPVADGRWTKERKEKIRNSRILGTRRIAEAIKDSPSLKVFVLGSAMGFYGDRGDEVVDESTPPGNDFLAKVVVDWEAEARALEPRVRVPMIRTGLVFSRYGGALTKMLAPFRAGLGGRLGAGQQWMSWIHIDDIARLFLFALETPEAIGPMNGTAPEPLRNERFTVEFARALKRPVFLPVPANALKILFGELAQSLLTGQRVLPKIPQELGFKFLHPDIVPALRDLLEPLQGAHRELLSEQWVPRTPDQLFPFFSSAENLERITPPMLGFKVLKKSTKEIQEGTLIDYKLSLRGIPFGWRTKIEEWEPNKRFVDTQLKGPYKLWLHTHEFIPFAGGTLLRDRVRYHLPLGWLGDSAAGWRVDQDVANIFAYRRKVIGELFGQPLSTQRNGKANSEAQL